MTIFFVSDSPVPRFPDSSPRLVPLWAETQPGTAQPPHSNIRKT
jgi:hypothetical protein